MQGTMMIKEILACGRGRKISRSRTGRKRRGLRRFRSAFYGASAMEGHVLSFLFPGNEDTLPP